VVQPTPKFDPHAALALVRVQTGVELRFDGMCPGGEVGAAYVRWPDGRRSVLGGGNPAAAALTALARSAGIPAPAYELSGDGWVVQECLPGRPPSSVDSELLAELVALNARFAGLGVSLAPTPLPLYLTSSGPGFCVHESLERCDGRTRRLLRWVREVGAETDTMTGADLVHLDFHPGNVLVDGGRVTGLIDWDGATRGDRHFDLVTLRFWLTGRHPHLLAPIDQRLAGIPRRRHDAYWAHISLRMVDWSIRHHDEATVDHWLTVAESGLDGDRPPG
jgi:aminoglycoside phosphotransferase (APT) family kinase protein